MFQQLREPCHVRFYVSFSLPLFVRNMAVRLLWMVPSHQTTLSRILDPQTIHKKQDRFKYNNGGPFNNFGFVNIFESTLVSFWDTLWLAPILSDILVCFWFLCLQRPYCPECQNLSSLGSDWLVDIRTWFMILSWVGVYRVTWLLN